jgi:ABC-type Fe3+-hydroxamate transport system substrate-binding protein
MSHSEAARARATLRAHPRVHWQCPVAGRAARRIVSLVPSLSEALVVLGLGDRLVGVTEYCVHPAGAFAALPKLGGTKDADALAIAALAPDLVIANQEENTPRVVRQLADGGIDVWVTYPRTVREGIDLLAALAGLGASPERSAAIVAPARAAFEQAEASTAGVGDSERPRVFCPIWRDPWMTIARDTYIHDMIELCGGRNVFAGSEPGADAPPTGDRRYPIVSLDAVERAQPDIILLPDEPYAFSEPDRAELGGLDCEAARRDRIHLIDGTLVSWYGPRIAQAIRVLAGIFATS